MVPSLIGGFPVPPIILALVKARIVDTGFSPARSRD